MSGEVFEIGDGFHLHKCPCGHDVELWANYSQGVKIDREQSEEIIAWLRDKFPAPDQRQDNQEAGAVT